MRRRGRLEVWLKLTQSHAQDNRGRKRTFSQSLLLFDPEQKWLTASFTFTIFTFFEPTRFAFFLQIFCAHFSILAKFEICAKILALCVITSPLLGLLHRWPWNQDKIKIMVNSLPQMQIVGPEHLLQVVTALQVGLVQEMFKVDWLKVDGLVGREETLIHKMWEMIVMLAMVMETS